jgi:peptidoglycan/xylan/chitin deacetylase (PgdA/CDA1 family)/folate-dependent phosphoribosylglycinamide formyltransferase PurN
MSNDHGSAVAQWAGRPKLKVTFLIGNDDPSTRQSIEAVCRLPGVEPVGVLLDTGVASLRRRQKNLFRNIRANGWSYPIFRIIGAIRTATSRAANTAAVSRIEASKVLQEAFPDTCFSLAELKRKYGMAIHAVGNLNGANAVRVLGECGADLGIVLGTRILKASTFSVPRVGCINLHKGRVPDYRGLPPGFWELYDGASSAGVTVHFVDKGLDTGDIVTTSSVSILKTETPESLLEKLHAEGARALAAAVAVIRDGKVIPQPQEQLERKARSTPTRKDVILLRRRLPHWKVKGDVSTIVRNLYLLFVYYSGLYFLVRQWHRLSRSRGAIFLQHRVNDYSKDSLTVDCETFAAQLLAISKRYPFSSTADLVACVLTKTPLQPTTIAIHFDDCYLDILTNAAPIMKVLDIPACAFINSGFIDTRRSFPHDVAEVPFTYDMLRSADVRAWSNLGFEVGAHTVNHVDLAKCTVETARHEIIQCGQDLEKVIGKPIDLFSFPFGRQDNISAPTKRIIRSAGYMALFSARGGVIGPRTDAYDIPRAGANSEAPPVYCLLQIEGLTLPQIAAKLRDIWSSSATRHAVLDDDNDVTPEQYRRWRSKECGDAEK